MCLSDTALAYARTQDRAAIIGNIPRETKGLRQRQKFLETLWHFLEDQENPDIYSIAINNKWFLPPIRRIPSLISNMCLLAGGPHEGVFYRILKEESQVSIKSDTHEYFYMRSLRPIEADIFYYAFSLINTDYELPPEIDFFTGRELD